MFEEKKKKKKGQNKGHLSRILLSCSAPLARALLPLGGAVLCLCRKALGLGILFVRLVRLLLHASAIVCMVM